MLQPKGGGTFNEGILHLERRDLISAWDQRTRRKMASDSISWWPLLWILGCFYCNWKNKANKLLKYCKTFDSPKYIGDWHKFLDVREHLLYKLYEISIKNQSMTITVKYPSKHRIYFFLSYLRQVNVLSRICSVSLNNSKSGCTTI